MQQKAHPLLKKRILLKENYSLIGLNPDLKLFIFATK